MLVLTRKEGEQLVINGDIIVTVVSCGNGRIRLGVQAPQHVTVDRGEVHERKMEFMEVKMGTSVGSAFSRLMDKPSVRERREVTPMRELQKN